MTRIVAAVDFSPLSIEALDYALDLARATGAEVHAVYVLPWPNAGRFEAPGGARTAAEEEGAERRRAVDALRALLTDAADVSTDATIRRSRDPVSALTTYAEAAGADLLVAGACGERCPRLGAVAAELSEAAPCDVLLIPPGFVAPEATPRRVLAAVDGSAASEPLLTFAFGLAGDLGAASVDVAHVLEPMPYAARWMQEALLGAAPEIRDRATTDLCGLVEAARRQAARPEAVEVAVHVERGKAAPALARLAEALRTDLLIVGPHAERPAFDRLLGSTARNVVRRMPCPVLVARRSVAVGGTPPRPEAVAEAV
ncbi:MAG: universal stress protein [Bacteroidota bacterium]